MVEYGGEKNRSIRSSCSEESKELSSESGLISFEDPTTFAFSLRDAQGSTVFLHVAPWALTFLAPLLEEIYREKRGHQMKEDG